MKMFLLGALIMYMVLSLLALIFDSLDSQDYFIYIILGWLIPFIGLAKLIQNYPLIKKVRGFNDVQEVFNHWDNNKLKYHKITKKCYLVKTINTSTNISYWCIRFI